MDDDRRRADRTTVNGHEPAIRILSSIPIGPAALVVACIVSLTAVLVAWPNSQPSCSVSIENRSGQEIRFERITIDGKIIGLKSRRLLPNSDENISSPASLVNLTRVKFQPSRRPLRLSVVAVNEMEERETVSFTLEKPFNGCTFNCRYYKGSLLCSDAGDSPKK